MTLTIKVINLLKTKPMTAVQLAEALCLMDNAHSVHNVINTLKRRNALLIVGKKTEYTSQGKKRPSSIYKLSETAETLKLRDIKSTRYKADLSKAIKNKERYKLMLMRNNDLFMMYSKELNLSKDLL